MPRKQHTYHYIYKTTCTVNGKFYIGMHSTSNLEDGYIGSGKRLWNSIRKYGRENHNREIVEYLPDRRSLKEREKQLVNESLLQDPMCMNLQSGGEGGFINEEHRLKCSAVGSPRGGKATWKKNLELTRTPEAKKKNMETVLERYGPGGWWKGKKHKEETKKKIGEKNSFHQKGENNSQYGKKWIFNENLKLSIRINRDDEIPLGWKSGRKMNFR